MDKYVELIDREAVREFIKSYRHSTDVAFDMEKHLGEIPAAPRWHRVEEPPKEEGMYIVAVFFSGHWIIDAAWFTHDITEIYCVPCEKKISGFYRGNHQVHPDYWMPIEPPKEGTHENRDNP